MDAKFFRLPVFLKKSARKKLALFAGLALLPCLLSCLIALPVLADPAAKSTNQLPGQAGQADSLGKKGQPDVTAPALGVEKAKSGVAGPANEPVHDPGNDPVREPGRNPDAAQDTAPDLAPEQEQAVYPGVRNECLKLGGNGKPGVILYYPAFGLDAVDADLAAFALGLAKAFISQSDQENEAGSDGGNTEDDGSGRASIEMTGFYELNRPSEKIVSLTFSLYSYTGGAHGNLEVVCLNYDLANASRLAMADLFSDPEKALEIMSGLAKTRLAEQLGNEAEEEMLETGTMPTAENFACLTLTSVGVRVEFPPYQVAPWFAGPQRVMITLPELAGAGPSARIWPAAASLPAGKVDATNDDKPERQGGNGEEIP